MKPSLVARPVADGGRDLRHETVAAARQGPDHLLVGRGVTHRGARRVDGGRQRALAHDHARPDLLEQLALGDHPVAVPRQVLQEVERLRLNLDPRPAETQLAQSVIELELAEVEDQPGVAMGARPA